jgi:RNA polymerase sigma-70 factor (TIGR02960 family)
MQSPCEDAGVTEQALARARAGDEQAFRELTDPYRRELQLHVYRIVGSTQDAEDLLQETLLAAWRSLAQFEGRASVRSWLYRIATNRSLDALRANRRRLDGVQRLTNVPEPTRRAESIWLEPYPDALLDGIADEAPGPEAQYETRETIALAFIVGLQHLPPQQRAVLMLRDVLGFRAGEVAEILDTTEASVNSLLRRARAAFDSRLPAAGRERAPVPDSKLERDVVGSFADAVEAGDVDGMVALLTDDAWLSMPPEPWEYQGPTAIGQFLRDREVARGTLRLVPTRANTQPAFACYLPSPDGPRCPALRDVRSHVGRRPDIRDHLVRRQQRLPVIRTAALSRTAGVDPVAKQRHPRLGPRAVAGHRPVRDLVEDLARVRFHVAIRREIERGGHRLDVLLPKQWPYVVLEPNRSLLHLTLHSLRS